MIIALLVIGAFWACGLACQCANNGMQSLLDEDAHDLSGDDDAAPLIRKTFDVAP